MLELRQSWQLFNSLIEVWMPVETECVEKRELEEKKVRKSVCLWFRHVPANDMMIGAHKKQDVCTLISG